jgi:hypothetical protein
MQNRLRNSTPHMLTGLFCAQRKAGILQTPSTDFRASVWHLKEAWGFTYTLMKGKEHVLSEAKLMMMVYKLRRLMSILGVNDLKTKLKQLVLFFFAKLKLHRVDLRLFIFSI